MYDEEWQNYRLFLDLLNASIAFVEMEIIAACAAGSFDTLNKADFILNGIELKTSPSESCHA